MRPTAFLNGLSLLGFVTLGLFSILAFHFFFSRPALDTELVIVSATTLGAENERGHKRDVDLVVTLQGDNVRLRSSSPYPSKFRFGSRTPKEIKQGDRVTFILNRSEMEDAPRRNRVHGYLWREFVGMSTPTAVHLTPEDHERWHLDNQKISRYLYPALCLCGVYLIVIGYRVKRRSQQGGRANAGERAPEIARP